MDAKAEKRFKLDPWFVRAFVVGLFYQPILIGAAFFFPELRSFTTENIHIQTAAIKAITLFAGLLPGVIYVAVYLFSVFRARIKLSETSRLWGIFLSLVGQFVAMALGVVAFLPVLMFCAAIPPLRACLEFIFTGL